MSSCFFHTLKARVTVWLLVIRSSGGSARSSSPYLLHRGGGLFRRPGVRGGTLGWIGEAAPASEPIPKLLLSVIGNNEPIIT